MKYRHPVFVLGLGLPGIDILKYFHKKSIFTIGFDFRDYAPGFHLRKQLNYRCPDPEKAESKFIEFLLICAKEFDDKPVLLITSDTFIKAIQKNKKILKEYLLFNISRNSVIEDFLSKKGIYKRALSSGLQAPLTIFPETEKELYHQIDQIRFPCIIKPQFAPDWRIDKIRRLVQGQKVLIISNKTELVNNFNELNKLHHHKLIIQEIIQGPDENLIYFVSYINKHRKCIGYFCGQKLRITPIHFGSASFMKTINADLIKDKCIKFLIDNKYWGPSGIEFKKDVRDGQYKLVEINPRFGLWDVVGQKVGVDLYYLNYQDLIGEDMDIEFVPEQVEYRWIALTRDIPVYFEYKKEGLINFFEWIHSIFTAKIYFADIYLSEPKLMIRLYLKKILKKIRGVFKYV